MSKKKLSLVFVAIGICAVALTVVFLRSPAKNKQPTEAPAPGLESAGLSFLNMNNQTRITNERRESLKSELGPEAYATRTTINLEMHDSGFLAAYFPEINTLNRQLNYLPRGRVEYDAIRLTYRYARKKNTPLDFVRLIFASDTGKPLFFYIRTTQEGFEFLSTLKEKYGVPHTIEWANGKGQSYYWQQSDDYLIVSETKTRIGTPEFHFGFYFNGNIQSLLEKEQAKQEQRLNAPRETIQKVF